MVNISLECRCSPFNLKLCSSHASWLDELVTRATTSRSTSRSPHLQFVRELIQLSALYFRLLPQHNSATVASWTLAAVLLAGVPLLANPAPVSAISGGGLDYAELNLTGKDFSNGKYKSKVRRKLKCLELGNFLLEDVGEGGRKEAD